MPAKSFLLPLCATLIPVLAFSQINFNERGEITAAQNALPSQGPAAARFNPAALSDVHTVSVSLGNFGWTSPEGRQTFAQLALGWPRNMVPLPIALAAGFDYFGGFAMFNDLSNEIRDEGEYGPGFAAAYPADPDAPYRLSAGVDFVWGRYNAFNAMKSTSLGVDAGLAATHTGSHGRFGLGFAYHHLKSPEVGLPDDIGYFRIPGWMEPSVEWTSAGRLLHTNVDLFINGPHDRKDGPAPKDSWGTNGWEVELRPFPMWAVKLERTRYGPYSNIGFVLFPPASMDPFKGRVEINLGHTAVGNFLFGPGSMDNGTRWLIGLTGCGEI